MSKESGFLQLRRGVFEHIKDGRMSHLDGLVFIYIASQADTRTGVWNGSAGALAGELCLSHRNARRVLERLTLSSDGGYIKRFPVPGSHVCYPILVNKFLVTDGEHKGEHLNARDSKSAEELMYVRSEQECEQECQHSASQKILENRNKRKNHAAKAAADPRHKQAFDSCFEAYREKYTARPTWGSKEGNVLKRFLKEHASVQAEEIIRRYKHLLGSTERYHADKHGALCHLLSNFDTFADGPKFAPKEKISASDPIAASVKNSGLDENGRLFRPLPN